MRALPERGRSVMFVHDIRQPTTTCACAAWHAYRFYDSKEPAQHPVW
jgi:hypothetical protein